MEQENGDGETSVTSDAEAVVLPRIVDLDLCTPEKVLTPEELREVRRDVQQLQAAQCYRPPEYFTDLIGS